MIEGGTGIIFLIMIIIVGGLLYLSYWLIQKWRNTEELLGEIEQKYEDSEQIRNSLENEIYQLKQYHKREVQRLNEERSIEIDEFLIQQDNAINRVKRQYIREAKRRVNEDRLPSNVGSKYNFTLESLGV